VRDCRAASVSHGTKLASGRKRLHTSETRIGYEPMLAAGLHLFFLSFKSNQCLLNVQPLPTVRWGGTGGKALAVLRFVGSLCG